MASRTRTTTSTKIGLAGAGIVIGILSHFAGVLAFGTSRPIQGLICVGVAVMVSAARSAQHHEGPSGVAQYGWLFLGALVGLGGAMWLVPPKPPVRGLERAELPGLSIELPSGQGRVIPTTYDEGKVSVDHIGRLDPSGTVVGWHIGALDDVIREKAASAALLVAGKAVPATEVEVGGNLPAYSRRLGNDLPTLETYFACGRRVFDVKTWGRGTEMIHRHMLASVVCKPDVGR